MVLKSFGETALLVYEVYFVSAINPLSFKCALLVPQVLKVIGISPSINCCKWYCLCS